MEKRPQTIGNPLSWAAQAATGTGAAIGAATAALGPGEAATPVVRRIGTDAIRAALSKGMEDFSALRSDVLFLVVLYPIAGIAMALFSLDRSLLPMVFPLAAGFALVGPVAAIGLYEMSRQRERGQAVGWGTALGILRAGALSPVLALGGYLLAIFVMWMIAAFEVFRFTLGPAAPASLSAFLGDLFGSAAGWTMIAVGTGIGFVFAAVVLVISVVSFPMLIDRRVGLVAAVQTSVAVARHNPRTVATWGLVVAAGLVLGSIPLFLGLIFVLPILGHATWHLYRAAVAYEA